MEQALIIEDDPDVRLAVIEQLESIGFNCTTAVDGETGLETAQSQAFTLILLDLGLPRIEGIEVCKRLREQDRNIPIIILSSRNDDLNKVLLLELGADDYITKPFSPEILKARVRAVLRRTNPPDLPNENKELHQVLKFRGLQIDFLKRRVSRDGKTIELTAKEFDILAILASEPGRPFRREELNSTALGNATSAYEENIKSFINRIRKKIEPDPANPIYVLTARGVGYYFSDAEEN